MAVVALDELLAARRLWRGRPVESAPPAAQPTGLFELDAILPGGGWPESALTELLIPAAGMGELQLLWPALARLSSGNGVVALVDPPYLPYAPAWHAAGVRLQGLHVIRADAREAMWAAEQCLRSGACTAVLCWPKRIDDRTLRRLQVAAETGQCHGFALRPLPAARNPSPAALRIVLEPGPPRRLHVLKVRGAMPPSRPIAFPRPASR
jgi:hypothetical protein